MPSPRPTLTRAALLLTATAGLLGCPEKSAVPPTPTVRAVAPAPAAPAPAPAAPAAPAPTAAPAAKVEPLPADGTVRIKVEDEAHAGELPGTAEIELRGKVIGLTTGRGVVFLSAEPCDAPTRKVLGGVRISPDGGAWFFEVFLPQKSRAHLCVEQFDAAGKVTASAASPSNPLTLEGKGEVEVEANFTLAPLAAPRAAAPELLKLVP